MSTADDRRAHGVTRIPFDGMVEVGGALGPSFEAQAVNLSEEGMHLRTAYLPEVGQPITCRFDAGQGLVVVAAGEVLWKDDMGDGGEFGIRFTNLDSASAVALQRIVEMVEEGMQLRPPQGRKVRLHIEGLASPMRARVRGTSDAGVTAFSELGFLQVGKHLDLEDAATGAKRPALIDHVDVEVEQASRIPQLVVTLRYEDAAASVAPASFAEEAAPYPPAYAEMEEGADVEGDAHEAHAGEMGDAGDMDDMGDMDEIVPPAHADEHEVPAGAVASAKDAGAIDAEAEGELALKGALARSASKVGPALEMLAKQAKIKMTELAQRAIAKKGGKGDDVEIPVRRTTAPPPGGGLHTSGRRVIRGEIEERPSVPEGPAVTPRFAITKKRMIVGGSIGVAALIAVMALRKPAPEPVATTMPEETISASALESDTEGAGDPLSAASLTNGTLTNASADPAPPAEKVRRGRPTPFGNANVVRGNVIRVKMDGHIDTIQGAVQPAGFTVVIPGRQSLDEGRAVATKDARIAAVNLENQGDGTELTVTFKDGVPSYQVRARGDILELHLAKPAQSGERAPQAHVTKKKSPSKATTTKNKKRR